MAYLLVTAANWSGRPEFVTSLPSHYTPGDGRHGVKIPDRCGWSRAGVAAALWLGSAFRHGRGVRGWVRAARDAGPDWAASPFPSLALGS